LSASSPTGRGPARLQGIRLNELQRAGGAVGDGDGFQVGYDGDALRLVEPGEGAHVEIAGGIDDLDRVVSERGHEQAPGRRVERQMVDTPGHAR
jgi:hypothetical protein